MQSPILRLLLTCWMGTFCRGADPTSGLLRSAKYENMRIKFVPAEDANSPTIAPTALPALLPTSASAKISTRPTTVSTMPLNPMDEITDATIGIPSRRPVRRPIGRPTRRPTSLKVSMERSVPTSSPTATIVSNIQVTETLEGVSADQASEIELRTAIEFSVMAVLAPWASILSVHDITITTTSTSTTTNTACPGRRSAERRLVSGAVVSYTVTAKGSTTPEDIAAQLGKSQVNGEYLKVLRESSNLDIISITAFNAVNLNPSPTVPPSDSSSSTSSSNESGQPPSFSSTTVLAGGCVGGILIAFGAGLAYFYGVKGGKLETKKFPAIHMHTEFEDCDIIPDSPIKRSLSCISLPGGYDMIPAPKTEEKHSVV